MAPAVQKAHWKNQLSLGCEASEWRKTDRGMDRLSLRVGRLFTSNMVYWGPAIRESSY